MPPKKTPAKPRAKTTAAKPRKAPAKRAQKGAGLRSTSNMYGQPQWLTGAQNGNGFFGDLWSGVKTVVGGLRDSKAISTIAGFIPDPRAQAIARGAGQLGFGIPKGRPPMRNVIA